MNFKRTGALLGIAAATTMGLAACSDNQGGNGGGGDDQAKKVENSNCGGKANLKSSGSSAQANAMQIFANSFAVSCSGQTLDYNSNGSGAGVKEFTGGQTNFAGSDSALKEDEVTKAQETCGSEAWNLPAVFGPIALAYNLPGVEGLKLSGATAAKIFNGQIKKWNDPAIAAENAGVNLPDKDVTVIFRSDESGTTDNFQKYLKAASDGAWTQEVGKTFNGGVGEGAKGNDGVSAAVKGGEGAVTYTEWSYAKSQNLQMASIITPTSKDGVKLDAATAGKTIDSAKLKKEGTNDLVIDTSSFYVPQAEGAYPIIMPTYEIVCSKYKDPEVGKAVKAFLNIAVSKDVQGELESKGYIPVPDAFREKLTKAIDAIA